MARSSHAMGQRKGSRRTTETAAPRMHSPPRSGSWPAVCQEIEDFSISRLAGRVPQSRKLLGGGRFALAGSGVQLGWGGQCFGAVLEGLCRGRSKRFPRATGRAHPRRAGAAGDRHYRRRQRGNCRACRCARCLSIDFGRFRTVCAEALVEWLGGKPDEYCSSWTARAMAMQAYLKAKCYDSVADTCGVACTASLASDRPKRGRIGCTWPIKTPAPRRPRGSS